MHRPYERGVQLVTLVRDPESQERAREFLTFYFDFFIYFFVVFFSTKIHNFERSFSLSESSSVPPCKFLLEAMVQSVVA